MSKIRVLVSGACGRMGTEVVKAIAGQQDLELVAAMDVTHIGEDAGVVAGIGPNGIQVAANLAQAIQQTQPMVAVDFTTPAVVAKNLRTYLTHGVAAVIGATGLGESELEGARELSKQLRVPAIVVPNFAIGAVLLTEFAAQAARHFDHVEVIELHHDKKLDAPSGTAIKTVQMMSQARGGEFRGSGSAKAEEKIESVRGGTLEGVHIHSVRLPGLVAHQEVIFGGQGQTLTLRHDTINRECYMPGVIMAIRKVQSLAGLVYGLESILD